MNRARWGLRRQGINIVAANTPNPYNFNQPFYQQQQSEYNNVRQQSGYVENDVTNIE